LRAAGSYQKGDERILGNGDFVAQVLAEAQETFDKKYHLAAQGYNLDHLIERVAQWLGMSSQEILETGKSRQRVEARSLICYWATTGPPRNWASAKPSLPGDCPSSNLPSATP